MNILLACDNGVEARRIEEKLASAALSESVAFEAAVVSRLDDALSSVAEHPADVVLHLALPGKGGLDALTRFVAAAPEIAVVVMTATANDALATEAVREGAQDYVVKNEVDGPTLLRTLRYCIERKRAENSSKRLVEEQAARAKVEAAEVRARFLAEASRVLASSLDYEATLASIARLSVPVLGDQCFVDALSKGTLRRVAQAGAGQTGIAAPRAGENDSALRAIGTGEPLLVVEGNGSTLFVPLAARGQTLGSITLVLRAEDGARRYGREEIDLAVELAGRAALAADNARLYHEARAATAARDELLAILSHDLRNPLNVMTMTLGLLSEDHSISEERRSRHLHKLERATNRMMGLIDEPFDISRMDGPGLVVRPTATSAAEIVDQAVIATRAVAGERALRIHLAIPDGLVVRADAPRIVQVVTNLVTMAILISPGDPDVTVEAENVPGGVRFSISSSGVRLDADEIPRVYDRFWKKKNGIHESAGLGLAIAKGIVLAHGGEVGAINGILGATFQFTLPRS